MGWQHPFSDFSQRPQSGLGSIRPSVKSWLWTIEGTCHSPTGLRSAKSMCMQALSRCCYSKCYPACPTSLLPTLMMSVGRNHKQCGHNYEILRCIFPVALIKWSLKQTFRCKSGASQMSRRKLSDHKEVPGTCLPKRSKQPLFMLLAGSLRLFPGPQPSRLVAGRLAYPREGGRVGGVRRPGQTHPFLVLALCID